MFRPSTLFTLLVTATLATGTYWLLLLNTTQEPKTGTEASTPKEIDFFANNVTLLQYRNMPHQLVSVKTERLEHTPYQNSLKLMI